MPFAGCDYQDVSLNASYDSITHLITYQSAARVTTFVDLADNGAVVYSCALELQGAKGEILLDYFVYIPSTGQILAGIFPIFASGPTEETEIASLSYIDASTPGHSIYHFRGNDQLFQIAQQMYGINFTGVELTFDVETPSS